MLSQIPNLLTLLRIAAVPVLVLLLKDGAYEAAFLVFLAAGITDGLDGYIAKRFGFVTQLGATLDPVADKMLIISAYIMLALLGDMPFWLLLAVGFRDLLIIGGFLMLMALNGEVDLKPTLLSKVNTFLQISLVVAILVDRSEWLSLPMLVSLLVIGVLCTTVLSGAHYVWLWGIKPEKRESAEDVSVARSVDGRDTL